MKSESSNLLTNIPPAAEIRERLAVLVREAAALRTLLRVAQRVEAARQKPDQRIAQGGAR